MQIKDYIDSNKDRFLDELYDLLRIESVSADPKFKDSVDRLLTIWLISLIN